MQKTVEADATMKMERFKQNNEKEDHRANLAIGWIIVIIVVGSRFYHRNYLGILQ